ncbi:MAG TPA: hypothetical protein VMT57_07280 [Candidatus Thermoplasmatota archaeon]|nr:hypothetical protein [Candidatus Thermoplasmatota archaeon]
MNTKPVITYGMSAFLFLGLLLLFYHSIPSVAPAATSTQPFSQALWGTWGMTIVIIAFIIFAGGAGILVLLGGGWRWE